METKRVYQLKHRSDSPWGLATRFKILAWGYCWPLLCGWTPKPLRKWRNLILRIAGAKVAPGAFVHQRVKIEQPWNLRLDEGASVGDRVNLYTLDQIHIGEYAVIGPEAYLCTGTHEFDLPLMPLSTAPIVIEAGAFVGSRAFVMPGVRIGEKAVVGAMAVCTRDVPPDAVVAGNPARVIGMRQNSDTNARRGSARSEVSENAPNLPALGGG